MELTGQERIAAPRAHVWQALNDPEILKACIPGCESIELLSPTEMKARVALKLGPIKASFSGQVTLSRHRPAQRLHHFRRRQRRVGRRRQGQRSCQADRGCRRHCARLQCQLPGQRQDRPARRAAGRFRRTETGRRFLREVERAGGADSPNDRTAGATRPGAVVTQRPRERTGHRILVALADRVRGGHISPGCLDLVQLLTLLCAERGPSLSPERCNANLSRILASEAESK